MVYFNKRSYHFLQKANINSNITAIPIKEQAVLQL